MEHRHPVTLAQLTQAALVANDVPTLLFEAVAIVARALAVEHCAIWKLHGDERSLVLGAGVGWANDAVGLARIGKTHTLPIRMSELCGSTSTSVDWLTVTAFFQPPCMRDQGIVGSLYVLVPGQHDPVGILEVDITAPRIFNDDDRHFLQSVADVLALAIDRIQAGQTLAQQVAAAHNIAVREERQRLARDLHDSVTQTLYGVTLHARAATRLVAAGDLAGAADNLHVLQDTAQEVLDELRLLIFDLRPPLLKQMGLAAALRARLNAVEGRAHLRTQLIADQLGDLPPSVEEAVYRIAQEALNNALRHAQAHHIVVQLRQEQSRLILEISDDGVGFDVAAAGEAGGFGLCGIAERVAQLGGTFALHSAAGIGTQVRVELVV